MDAKAAVIAAKQYLASILEDEKPADIGLEEIERVGDVWQVTLGFSRPWNHDALTSFTGSGARRTFRTLMVRDTNGEVLSIKKHEGVGL